MGHIKDFKSYFSTNEKKSNQDSWCITIVTEEALEKAKQSKVKTHVSELGHKIEVNSESELAELKTKYQKGDQYEGETIARIIITKKGDEDYEE